MMPLDLKTKNFILEHEGDDINQLALRSASFPDLDMPFILQQLSGRKIAKNKIPSWYKCDDLIYPKHLSLEQCSSESTAIYKKTLVEKGTFIDLTGGMGVDFYFLSKGMTQSTYIESQDQLVEIAKLNFEALGLQKYNIVQSESVQYLIDSQQVYDTIYIDPARRSESGQKTVFIQDCTPNLLEIDEVLNQKSKKTIIKLSPMLDVTHALQSLSNISQVHIVSVNNECKELLLIKEKSTSPTLFLCVNILETNQQDIFSFTRDDEENSTIAYANTVLKYLYEPNSSIMKAGAYKNIANVFDLKKLHPNSHLYTTEKYIEDFPGRKFIVEQVIIPNKREIKQHLAPLVKANITTRNYPFSVAELRKQIKLKEGGDKYIFATTLYDDKKVLILCEKTHN